MPLDRPKGLTAALTLIMVIIGDPSPKPTHCSLFKAVAQIMPLLPAYAGFIDDCEYIFCVKRGSCCATATKE